MIGRGLVSSLSTLGLIPTDEWVSKLHRRSLTISSCITGALFCCLSLSSSWDWGPWGQMILLLKTEAKKASSYLRFFLIFITVFPPFTQQRTAILLSPPFVAFLSQSYMVCREKGASYNMSWFFTGTLGQPAGTPIYVQLHPEPADFCSELLFDSKWKERELSILPFIE